MHRQPQSCLSSLDSCPAASLPSSVPGCLAGIFSTLTHQNTAVFPKGSSPPQQSVLHPPGCSDRCGSELCQTHFQHTQPGALPPPRPAPDSCGCFLTPPLLLCPLPSSPFCLGCASGHSPFLGCSSTPHLLFPHLPLLPPDCPPPHRLTAAPVGPGTPITAPARPPTPHLQCHVPPFWGWG